MPKNDDPAAPMVWSGRASLTARILAVNILALLTLAGGFFYLDSYRTRLTDERLDRAAIEARMIADAYQRAQEAQRAAVVVEMARITKQRIRIYGRNGAKLLDSWDLTAPNYQLIDPETEAWRRHAARFMDRAIDRVVGAPKPALFEEPAVDSAAAWEEVRTAFNNDSVAVMVRNAADRTPMVSAAALVPGQRASVVFTTTNAREITKVVRAERFNLGIVLASVILFSGFLSWFLAQTIVRPLRELAISAQMVRQGRAREVEVPRLPRRQDEIGFLARAVSDMSQELRRRIDQTEAFAADVTHELKNPLASMSSAIDTLDIVKDETQRDQLIRVIREDVVRLDRLIGEIAEISRVDAELSRARFERIDVGALVGGIVSGHIARNKNNKSFPRIAFARPRAGTAIIKGDESRIIRAIDNVIDNAISFSPAGGLIEIGVSRVGEDVKVRIEDEGPGLPTAIREAIFDRFHSYRPEGEAFGKHSGLGLAIARAVFEAHDGSIAAFDRPDEQRGARFMIRLPAAEPAE